MSGVKYKSKPNTYEYNHDETISFYDDRTPQTFFERANEFLSKKRFLLCFGLLALAIDVFSSFILPTDSFDVMRNFDTNNLVKGKIYFLAASVLFLALINGFVLLFSESLIPFIGSGLMTGLVAARCYDSTSVFLGKPLVFVTIPVGIFLICAFIHNFARFYKKHGFVISPGKSLYGILAVSVAVTFGGLFKISFADYFSAMYYVFFLGIGMVLLYLLITTRLVDCNYSDVAFNLAVVLTFVGVFAAGLSFKSIMLSLDDILVDHHVPEWKFRNNFSTFMMICMPAPIMFTKRKRILFALCFVIFGTMALLGSRSGTFIGAAEFACCIIFMAIVDRKYRFAYIGILALCIAAFLCFKGYIFKYFENRFWNIPVEKGEQRWDLLLASVDDFLNAPVFGQGLGYKGNFDIYTPKAGAMGWYHMMIPQIIGSMGTVGIIAYGFQFANRIYVTVKNQHFSSWVLFLCYVGLFLMSQFNPGEFCPLPYELVAVMLFAVIEKVNSVPTEEKIIAKEEN